MYRTGVVLAGVALVACNPGKADGRSDTLYWHAVAEADRPSEEHLEEVELIFGLELVESDTPWEAVTIVSTNSDEYGGYSGGWSCTPFVFIANRTVRTLAHEIGHAYALGHTGDPDNLMTQDPVGIGTDLTDKQIETVRRTAWYIEEYCPY